MTSQPDPEDRRGEAAAGPGAATETAAPASAAPTDPTPPEPAAGPDRAPAPDLAAGTAAETGGTLPPPAAPAAAARAEEDEHHPSLAGRVLTWLFFLVAGGALFLWAGPRIAPNLPAGLAPVAAWLTPGATQEAAAQEAALAALRAELEARIAAIPAPVPGMAPEAVEALVAGRVAALAEAAAAERAEAAARLEAALAALRDQVSAADSADIERRLGEAATEIAGLKAALAALNEKLVGVVANGGQVSEETMTQIASFAAQVQGLSGQFAQLSGRLGELAQRIDEVEAASLRREAEAAERAGAAVAEAAARERARAVEAALAEVSARIEAGEPFAAALPALEAAAGMPVPEDLAALAATGIPTKAALLEMFPAAAHEAIRAAIRAEEGGGVLGSASAFLAARLATRSLTEREGTDPDAILSRVEARMVEGDLAAALAEAATLPPEAQAPLAAWRAAAEARERGLRAYAALRAALIGTN